MKDILQDLVAHTHALGFIPLIKVTASSNETIIEALDESRSVVIQAKTKVPVKEFDGVFGMPNLGKLDIHLKCPEYKENAKINVTTNVKDDTVSVLGLHFENEFGDFQNDYRFMGTELINEKLKIPKFKGASWEVEFVPSVANIQRLKFQSTAHSEESVFELSTKGSDLVGKFGDSNIHSGSFVFASDISGTLKKVWPWPIDHTISILNLPGDIKVKISDSGVMNISVDSGIAEYEYYILAQTK